MAFEANPESESSMQDLVIQALYQHLFSLPVPRSVQKRSNSAGSAAMFLFIVAIIACSMVFGNVVYDSILVKIYGRDFPAKVTAIGPIEAHGLNASRLISMEVMVNGKPIMIEQKVSEWNRRNLQIGQMLVVRCLPDNPQREPMIVSMGEDGWKFYFGMLLIISMMATLIYWGILREHALSRRDRYLAESGDIALGRVLKIKRDQGKINRFTYEYYPLQSNVGVLIGKFGLIFAQNLEFVKPGMLILVLVDPERPKISVPAIVAKWKIIADQ